MPDWIEGTVATIFFAICVVWALVSGKVRTGYGMYTREDEPVPFYTFVGFLFFMFIGGVFLELTQTGVIPDFVHR